MRLELDRIFDVIQEHHASDVAFVAGIPPTLWILGKMVASSLAPLTPEEIERYHRERDAEVTRLAKIEESRKNTMTIRSSPEDDGRLAGVVAAAVQAALGNKPERAKQDK